jgi:hypothetical protein
MVQAAFRQPVIIDQICQPLFGLESLLVEVTTDVDKICLSVQWWHYL